MIDLFLQRFMPDPFVIAILLTALTVALASIYSHSPTGEYQPREIVKYWGDGFWSLADFTLKMAMILISGYVVAISRPVMATLRFLIGFVNTPIQAVLFCTFAALLASWINWGLGLVVGGIVALEVGRRLPNVSYRVLVASSYSGFLVWHGGLSGSIPLVLNTHDKVSFDLIGELIPLSQTTFGQLNLIAVGSMIVLLPTINLWNLKVAGNEPARFLTETREAKSIATNPDVWINRSSIPVLIMFALAACYWYVMWDRREFRLNLDSAIFLFFMFGLLLHGNPNAFIKAVTEATPKVAPILIQYPLYAGIMAILQQSGLAEKFSEIFVEYSTAKTLPLMTFYSAGLLNLFVPTGGGQWAVQGPIVVSAARELGVDLPRVAIAVAWGDAWTNLLQPFWAIPLLTIAGLNIKDIIGFCLVTLFASGTVLSVIFLLF